MASRAEATDAMYAATIEVRHDCPVGNMSRTLPGLRIAHWCANNRDLFQVSGPRDQVQRFREWVEAGFGARLITTGADGLLVFTQSCRCAPTGRSIGATIRSTSAWDIPPIVYHEGWESWRFLAGNEQTVRDVFAEIRAFSEMRIVSLRPIENVAMERMMLVPAADIFAGLTDRQSSAVLLGLRHGYFSMPSETNIERLAGGVGVSASTFGEHLRKAQARILLNLRPYLEAYATRAPGEVAVEEVRPLAEPRARASGSAPAVSE